MNRLTYPRSAEDIAARARMNLAAFRAVPCRETTHGLDRSLHDMWGYGYFALRNEDDIPLWTSLTQELFDALQLLKPVVASQLTRAARAAADAVLRFEEATGITPGSAPERLYTRTEVEQITHAAFERLRLYSKPDHDSYHRFVTAALLAFLDNPLPASEPQPDDAENSSDERPELESGPPGDRR
ncbi:hypothetical protein [Streptomyces tsukubensis]|uniref:hypothetical protein n=1 Tax=Streptomyces tsukubensis TaxID=83656 RepID=UPI00344C6629